MINQLSHLFTTSVPKPHKLGIVYNKQDTHSLFFPRRRLHPRSFPLSFDSILPFLLARTLSHFLSFTYGTTSLDTPSNFRFLLTTNLFLRAGLSILYPPLPSFSTITSKETLPSPFLSLFVVSSPITLGGLIENSLNSVFIFFPFDLFTSVLMEFPFATHRRRSLCAVSKRVGDVLRV